MLVVNLNLFKTILIRHNVFLNSEYLTSAYFQRYYLKIKEATEMPVLTKVSCSLVVNKSCEILILPCWIRNESSITKLHLVLLHTYSDPHCFNLSS